MEIERSDREPKQRLTRLSLIRQLAESMPAPPGESINIGCKETDLGDVRLDIAGQPEIRGTALSLPLRKESFSVAILSEVLEHVPRGTENLALTEIRRILKDDGVLVLSTPSAQGVWGKIYWAFDPAFWLTGHRHYREAQLRALLEGSGFQIEFMTRRGGIRELLFSILTPFAYAIRKVGLSWNLDLESDYSTDTSDKGYTHVIRAIKRPSS